MKKVILLSFVLFFMGACKERLCVSKERICISKKRLCISKELKSSLLAKFAPRDKSTNEYISIDKYNFTSTSRPDDIRCEKIRDEAREKAKKSGICDERDLSLVIDTERQKTDPDYKACKAFLWEEEKKCTALRRVSYIPESGSVFINVDGEGVPIEDLRVCEECPKCRELHAKETNQPDEKKQGN